jgi:hypothetical protein
VSDYTVRIDDSLKALMGTLEELGKGDLLAKTARVALLEAVTGMANDAAVKRMTRANPPYLNVDTGTGRASVTASPNSRVDGDLVRASFGSQHKYIRAHELGFDGMVAVRAHMRRPTERIKSVQYVRGHARHVRMRARHFLLDSLQAGKFRALSLTEKSLVWAISKGTVPTQYQLAEMVR